MTKDAIALTVTNWGTECTYPEKGVFRFHNNRSRTLKDSRWLSMHLEQRSWARMVLSIERSWEPLSFRIVVGTRCISEIEKMKKLTDITWPLIRKMFVDEIKK